MIVDINDEEMINAKTGNWWIDNPQRSRTNNSVLLLRNETSKEQFDKIISLNNEKNDIGFAFANS
jgi:ribonucleoside-diphosphate reductase alpha chain